MKRVTNLSSLLITISVLALSMQSCHKSAKEGSEKEALIEAPEYFHLRPDLEKTFGYTHAVKIGDVIKISGAVSMDEAGNPSAKGDLLQQMKNCYADLDLILKHYGCTFDDVVVENVFTTDMPALLQHAGYRTEIYKKQFPTGSWVGVKELVSPEFMIEIELEARIAKK